MRNVSSVNHLVMRKQLTKKYKMHMYAVVERAIVICSICILVVIFASSNITNKNIAGHVDNVLMESNNFVLDARMCNINSVSDLQAKMYERVYNEQKNRFYHFAGTVLDN